MTGILIAEPFATCEQCGEYDPDPKVHYGFNAELHTWHHDCTPKSVIDDILGGFHSQHALVAARIFNLCKGDEHKDVAGLRGDDLRAAIQKIKMPKHGDATAIWANPIANAILDALLNGAASGTTVVGAITLTWPGKLKFLSTVSTASSAGTEWTTSGGYTAGGVSLSGVFSANAASGAKASGAAVSVTNAPTQTWADNEAVDSTGTPNRLWAKGTPSLAIAVASGSTCTIPSGSLTGATT